MAETTEVKSKPVEQQQLQEVKTTTSNDNGEQLKHLQSVVDGSTTQYTNGRLRLIPAPSNDPNDPLNFKMWEKVVAIFSISLFGAIVVSMQQIVAGMLPIFMFYYAGKDPKVLNQPGGFGRAILSSLPPPVSPSALANPLEALGNLPGAQPLTKVSQLYSIPVLIVGLSNYVIVPASVACGRRAVIIFCATLCTACTVWAGMSTSLESHLVARCLHAIGTGATESLIPLIIQDMTFVHQRNRAISATAAIGALLSVSLGVGSTYCVANLGWRWLYFICAIINGLALVLIIFFVRETRWHRTSSELRGEPSQPGDSAGVQQTTAHHTPSRVTFKTRYGLFLNGGVQWHAAWTAFIEILSALILPIVMYIVLLNAIMLGITTGASLTTTAVLLSPPYNWPFNTLGLVVIAGAIASVFVVVLGNISDRVVQWITRRRQGRREAEYNLWNFFFPLFVALVGCVVMGVGGQYLYQVHWMAIVCGMTLLAFGLGVVGILCAVTAIESYPKMAGPVLVNVASFRNLVSFAFTYGTPEWTAKRGYMAVFGIFAAVIVLVSLPLPLFIVYGKRLRMSTRFVGKVASTSL